MSSPATTARHPRGRLADGAPNPVDVHIGRRVRLRRMLLGLSQEKLADALGLTFQQVQKYERGANRIGGSRLFDLSQALDVPVSYFYDDMPDDVKNAAPRNVDGGTPSPTSDVAFHHSRETLELVRDFHAIANPAARSSIRALAKSLAVHPAAAE